MSEFSRQIALDASAEDVFRLFSEPANLPRFIPTLQEAELEENGRLRLRGVREGHPYEVIGFWHADARKGRVEWNSEDLAHQAWIEVRRGDTTSAVSEVTAHLTTGPIPDPLQFREENPNDREEHVQEMLWRALTALRRLVEGTEVRRA
jgi:hypothetical protein